MEKLYCSYCGGLLEDGCECEKTAAEEQALQIEELEERQHQSGFYAFQDTMDMWRNER